MSLTKNSPWASSKSQTMIAQLGRTLGTSFSAGRTAARNCFEAEPWETARTQETFSGARRPRRAARTRARRAAFPSPPQVRRASPGVPDVCWDVCLRAALVGAVVTLHKAQLDPGHNGLVHEAALGEDAHEQACSRKGPPEGRSSHGVGAHLMVGQPGARRKCLRAAQLRQRRVAPPLHELCQVELRLPVPHQIQPLQVGLPIRHELLAILRRVPQTVVAMWIWTLRQR